MKASQTNHISLTTQKFQIYRTLNVSKTMLILWLEDRPKQPTFILVGLTNKNLNFSIEALVQLMIHKLDMLTTHKML